jgi:hypothetical protein
MQVRERSIEMKRNALPNGEVVKQTSAFANEKCSAIPLNELTRCIPIKGATLS